MDPTLNSTSAPVSTDGTQGTDAVTSPTPTKAHSSSGKITNVNNLRKDNPDVWKQLSEGIATTICNQMKASQDRIRQMRLEDESK